MPKHPAKSLEEKQAWLRARMAQRAREEAAQAPPKRLPSPRTVERREKLNGQVGKYLRVNEVADELGVSPNSVKRWLRPVATMVGGQGTRQIMLISRRALDEWLAEHAAITRRA